MTVSADVLYLPMLTPVRLPFRQPTQSEAGYPSKEKPDAQHRIYRMPPHDRQDGFVYGPGGYVSSEQSNGHLVDLYV